MLIARAMKEAMAVPMRTRQMPAQRSRQLMRRSVDSAPFPSVRGRIEPAWTAGERDHSAPRAPPPSDPPTDHELGKDSKTWRRRPRWA
jgi:hypothetical protein